MMERVASEAAPACPALVAPSELSHVVSRIPGSTFSAEAQAALSHTAQDPTTRPFGREITCTHHTPIVLAMDVTRSRGNDSKILWDKLPMFYGQIMQRQYAEDPAISFAAIGDATAGDTAPLQVCDFAVRDELDAWISRLFLEEGGGGTGQESYELAVLYFARRCRLPELPAGKKGIMFITGDERYYEKVDKDQIQGILGPGISEESVLTSYAFEQLKERFDTYFLFPVKAAEQRKADIDAEFARRLNREGAKSGEVTVSLMWNNLNDLDLHVITPSGEEIYFGHRGSACGGCLDVDMNAGTYMSETPVENIFWSKKAPRGTYRVDVVCYSNRCNVSFTPFRVCVRKGNSTKYFEGHVGQSGDRTRVTEFTYGHGDESDGSAAKDGEHVRYDAYENGSIIRAWETALGPSHVCCFPDSKAAVDIMLGCIALHQGVRTVAQYLGDMEERGQSPQRCEMVRAVLERVAMGPECPPMAPHESGKSCVIA